MLAYQEIATVITTAINEYTENVTLRTGDVGRVAVVSKRNYNSNIYIDASRQKGI